MIVFFCIIEMMMNIYKKDRITFIYVLLMLGTGAWQLIDWYFGSEDPLWHLLFYIFFMPFLSLYYAVYAGDRKKAWMIPLLSGGLSALVYVFMGNGGFSLDTGALMLAVPSFAAAAAGDRKSVV